MSGRGAGLRGQDESTIWSLAAAPTHLHHEGLHEHVVTIDFAEIQAGREGNFYKAGSDAQGENCGDDVAVSDLGAYDPGSMMHYGPLAFAIGTNPTIIPKPGVDGSVMGQRAAVGPTDAETIDLLYGPNNAAPSPDVQITGDLLEGSSLLFDGSGTTDTDDDDDPNHTYVQDGSYDWTLDVTDGFDGDDTDGTLVILNVAPIVNAGPDAEVESGQTYAFSGTFSDPGIEDDPWEWVIDWGDGTDMTGSTDDQSAPIEASLQVCTAGTYTVELEVTDKDGGVGTDDLELTVPYVAVEIDIMPGTDLNPINLKKGGNVPVAILGSADFDVADVDPSTLVLGDESDPDTEISQKNNGAYEAYMEDVNDDGFMDLVAMFPNRDLVMYDLTEATTELALRGFQADACTNFRGVDDVSVPAT